MQHSRRKLVLALAIWLGSWTAIHAGVRIKDITDLEGARSNRLKGIGLVVGLNGTGDKGSFTQQVAVDMLQRFNITTQIVPDGRNSNAFKSSNVSVVTVTAELGPFNRKGSRLDVTVSALDAATSLFGGFLMETTLRGADNVVYALASGDLILGGYSVGASGGSGNSSASATTTKNHPTVARIPGGAMTEGEVRGKIVCNGQLRLLLRVPDPITSRSIAKAINKRHPNSAIALDAGSVQVFVPEEHLHDVVSFVADIGLMEVNPDSTAKVVINERTGTVIAGEHVKVSRLGIVQGNLSISTSVEPDVSQPAPFSRGKTKVVPRPQVGVLEQGGVMQVLEPTVTVAELARALNALGATPRDLIAIFQDLKAADGLHAELVVVGR